MGAKAFFVKNIGAEEGFAPGDVEQDRRGKPLKLGTPYSEYDKDGRPVKVFSKPEALATGREPSEDGEGKINRLSLLEATMQADMGVAGVVRLDGGRKLSQFRMYLDGLKQRIEEIPPGERADKVTVTIHYVSLQAPAAETQTQFAKDLQEAGLKHVTVVWHVM
jgi:hypothetical protein